MVLDRMTMAHSLEARSPFMDHELHAYVARLPSRLKVRGRRLRVAQTLLARQLLPPELLRRGKQGFASAIPYLLRDELELLHRAFLTESRLAEAGLLNPDGISTLLAEHRVGRRDHGSRLGLLLNAEVWFRTFMDGDSESRLLEVVEKASGGIGVGAGSES
jgi:asparagine synthase (glutamine-hydrolysing)